MKIGIATGGGDCPGLNAVIRAIAKAASKLGRMVAWQGSQITDIPLADAVGRLKTVPPESNLIRTARALGISLGD